MREKSAVHLEGVAKAGAVAAGVAAVGAVTDGATFEAAAVVVVAGLNDILTTCRLICLGAVGTIAVWVYILIRCLSRPRTDSIMVTFVRRIPNKG